MKCIGPKARTCTEARTPITHLHGRSPHGPPQPSPAVIRERLPISTLKLLLSVLTFHLDLIAHKNNMHIINFQLTPYCTYLIIRVIKQTTFY